MRVIGTAGHVDHGKSTLVTALTGINPDRLKEEQAREMTIELGFAWLTLPDGETAGVVDVPGHRDFIENMLAGVGGIDAVLFVVAADEGVMPQTREHLAILNLLQVPAGIIVLTKCDLIEDAEWFDLLEMDIRQAAEGTVLEKAPILRVSARSGAGLVELKHKLAEILATQPIRPDFGRPRLSIDRVFSMAGFGTVVTGTLLDGQFKVGDEVVVLPATHRGRVRGLQTHKTKVESAMPGSRTAVNISGVEHEKIKRGDVLSIPGKYAPTQMVDVHFVMQRDASASLKHNSEVKFFLGAAEVTGRVRLLGGLDECKPGMEGWLQLELAEAVVAARGDRYILRRPSPGETLGGGEVVDPHPAKRYKRNAKEVIERLESIRVGSPRDVLLQAWMVSGIVSARDAAARSRLTPVAIQQALEELVEGGDLIQLEPGKLTEVADILMVSSIEWARLTQLAQRELEQYHRTFSLRKGMSREEFKNKLKLSGRALNAALRLWVERSLLVERGALVALSSHTVGFSAQQKEVVDRLMGKFATAPFTPPSVKECVEEAGEELYGALLEGGELIQVAPEVVFASRDYGVMVEFVRQHLSREGKLTVAQFRDQFNSSRKYVLGFLEYLDTLGITRREGDFRVAGRR